MGEAQTPRLGLPEGPMDIVIVVTYLASGRVYMQYTAATTRGVSHNLCIRDLPLIFLRDDVHSFRFKILLHLFLKTFRDPVHRYDPERDPNLA